MIYQPTHDEIRTAELRRLFDAYMDPRHEFWGLVNVLGSIQKEYGPNWQEHVQDVMRAMELHDGGFFPDEWFPPDPD